MILNLGKNSRGEECCLLMGHLIYPPDFKLVGDKQTPLTTLKCAEGDSVFTLKCWKDNAERARALQKFDSIIAIASLSTREYDGKVYEDYNCNELITSRVATGTPVTAADFAAANKAKAVGKKGTSLMDGFADISSEDIPF